MEENETFMQRIFPLFWGPIVKKALIYVAQVITLACTVFDTFLYKLVYTSSVQDYGRCMNADPSCT